MANAKTRCLVCQSDHRAYIEEMLVDRVPLRIISERMDEVYSETISYGAIQRHRDNHMKVVTVEKTSVTKKVVTVDEPSATPEPSVTKETQVEAEEPLTEIEMLEERVNALEIILAEQTSTASYTGFTSYTLEGKTNHSISYRDVITERMPNKKDIQGQYKALVARAKARMVKEEGLVLSDESFIKPRAELNKKSKAEAEAGLAAAEEELRKREIEKKNFSNAIEQLIAAEKRNAR